MTTLAYGRNWIIRECFSKLLTRDFWCHWGKRRSMINGLDQCTKVLSECVDWNKLKSFQNKKGLKIFQLPTFRCLFLQLAAEKKHRKVGSWKIFRPFLFWSDFSKLEVLYLCNSFEKASNIIEIPNIPRHDQLLITW